MLYIYDDFEDAEKCINNILENTRIGYELILIDDCSADSKIIDTKIKDLIKKLENVKIKAIYIRNHKKLGFFKSVNIGIKISKGDVVLIKNNIVVTNRWLQKMVIAAYSDEKIGTVTPLCNHSKFFSDIIAEIIGVQQLKPDEIAFLIENVSEHLKPEIINPDESCIYIKRKTLNDVGLFDERINDLKKAKKDFYLKISDNRWKNIMDDSIYVYKTSDSHEDLNKCFGISSQIKNILKSVKLRVGDLDLSIPKKRLLYILHENAPGISGGTGQTTRDIIEKIDETFECYILVSKENALILWKREQNQTIMLKSLKIRSKWSIKEFYNDEFKIIYFQILIGLNIDIVHIEHLIGHTFDLPKVAKNLCIPIILSFNDFYFVCPSIHLLDSDNHYCEGKCTRKKRQCYVYKEDKFKHLPLLSDFIGIWRKEVSQLFDNCTTFTTPTASTMNLYISIYPQLKYKPYKSIEHGRDFKKKIFKLELPSKNSPIKILVPGNIKHHKGHDFIKKLKENDPQNWIEFHFMGSVYDDLKKIGIYHGKYKREDFCKIAYKIQPSFIGIFSICPETYCHTLSEAGSCGIPVLTTKLGALKE
ncbi:MAG: glycosyltransferase [Methanobacterium sp.]|nr:glycosyltransferase [Methanobacterium sp.]